MTVVALMTAVALTPGLRSSWSALSRDMSDTIRWLPHAISTCAITLSRFTEITVPVRRLRALVRVVPARSVSSRVSSPAGTKRCPLRRSKATRPARSQRRSVSTLTPSALAAAPMRIRSSMSRRASLPAADRRQADRVGEVAEAHVEIPPPAQRDRPPPGAGRGAEQAHAARALLLRRAVERGDERRLRREVERAVLGRDLLEAGDVAPAQRERAVGRRRRLALHEDLARPPGSARERALGGPAALAGRPDGSSPPQAVAPHAAATSRTIAVG